MLLSLSATRAIVFSIVFVAAVVAVMLYFDTDKEVLNLLLWLESRGMSALLWFVLIMALVVVLLLPGIILTTGAGFVFGVLQGTAAVVVGTTLGASMAFLIARHLFGPRTQRYILSHPKLKVLSSEMAFHGFKVVLLTRLVPFFPSKLANYVFGLTGVSLRDYVRASIFGFIPYSLHNVYLGSIAADIVTLGSRDFERTPLEWGFYTGGFVLTIGAVLYLARLANRLLAEQTGAGSEAHSTHSEPGDEKCRG